MTSPDMQVMAVPPYIRVRDARTYFGLSDRSVWKMLANRQIKGTKKGGKEWVISSISIIKFLTRNQNV